MEHVPCLMVPLNNLLPISGEGDDKYLVLDLHWCISLGVTLPGFPAGLCCKVSLMD